MSIADVINGSFELLGGLFCLTHCRTLYKHKEVRGVSMVATGFFSLWGFWNLYYYPSLGQWMSFFGGLAIVVANTIWLGMMVYYKYNKKALT